MTPKSFRNEPSWAIEKSQSSLSQNMNERSALAFLINKIENLDNFSPGM